MSTFLPHPRVPLSVPELCVLELRTRYAEFFTPPTGPPIQRTEEEIFMATGNPFIEGNSINHGTTTTIQSSTTSTTTTTTTSTTTTPTPSHTSTRSARVAIASTEGLPFSSSSEQQFSSFIPLDGGSTESFGRSPSSRETRLPVSNHLLLVDNSAEPVPTDFTTPFPMPESIPVSVNFEAQFEFPTLVTGQPTEEATTVRADVFASPAGFSGL